MRIGVIASSAEYRIDEQFQNLPILELNFNFLNWKKFYKFVTFPTCKILEFC